MIEEVHDGIGPGKVVGPGGPLAEDVLDVGYGRVGVLKVRGWEARQSVEEVIGKGETVSRGDGFHFVGHVGIPGEGRSGELGGRGDVEHVLFATVGDVYLATLEF